MNHQEHGQIQKGETLRVRGTENEQDFHYHADSGETLSADSGGVRSEFIGLNREDSAARGGDCHPFGGVLDQLIDDTRKQLVKSNECIVWYREEVKEYEEKLKNLIKLKEQQEEQYQEMRRQQEMLLQQQQLIQQQLAQQQQLIEQQQRESSSHSGENLAE
ncbi:hypothetical protein QUB05_05650 [Microcoleus sp. F10-C6]|uniref:hypothetical protein n=1 Tax=unclassified Microcoleus TaxID=2642155 RepID=UPI002FCFB756